MKYRDAKSLKPGDQVKSKLTGDLLVIVDLEFLGGLKLIRLNCIDQSGKRLSLFNEEIE